jgi:hypothetical protein
MRPFRFGDLQEAEQDVGGLPRALLEDLVPGIRQHDSGDIRGHELPPVAEQDTVRLVATDGQERHGQAALGQLCDRPR